MYLIFILCLLLIIIYLYLYLLSICIQWAVCLLLRDWVILRRWADQLKFASFHLHTMTYLAKTFLEGWHCVTIMPAVLRLISYIHILPSYLQYPIIRRRKQNEMEIMKQFGGELSEEVLYRVVVILRTLLYLCIHNNIPYLWYITIIILIFDHPINIMHNTYRLCANCLIMICWKIFLA